MQPLIGLLCGQPFAYGTLREQGSKKSVIPLLPSPCLFVEITSSGTIPIAFATTLGLIERTLLNQLIGEHLKQLA